MSYHVVLESCPWHTRAALFNESGRLVSLRYEDPSRAYIEGAVAWGVVRRLEKSLGGAFVDIGDVEDGFLSLKTLPPGMKLTQGSKLVVRVVRGGFMGKGARLDARVAVPEPSKDTPAPKLLQHAPSALTRALHDAGANPVTCWIPDARLRDVARAKIAERQIKQLNDVGSDWLDRLDDELDRMQAEHPTWEFALPGGGRGSTVVEMTSAVATIDINAGPSAAASRAEAVLAANFAAAAEVVRLSRLLDLGGSVIVDFITPYSKAHRDLITTQVQKSFEAQDERIVEVRRMSRFGLLELNRERGGPSLSLLLKTAPFIAGRILLELWRNAPGVNPHVRQRSVIAHPEVIRVLENCLLTETCLRELGLPVHLHEAPPERGLNRYQITG